jgi:GNAT superfamily N-acetyltransferase
LRVTDVRKATTADLPRVSEALGRAFWDDPVMRFLIPTGDKQLQTLMKMEVKSSLKQDTAFMTADGGSAALWKPPGRWRTSMAELVAMAPLTIGALRRRILLGLTVLTAVEKKHPNDPPHWYLAVLGTEPAAQGKGNGSAVLQPVLQQCDENGESAYLESSKEKNIPFYERHGFRVTEEIALPKGGPPIWGMWRDPQT